MSSGREGVSEVQFDLINLVDLTLAAGGGWRALHYVCSYIA